MVKAKERPTIGSEEGPRDDERLRLLSAIFDVLDEMADAEADAAYHIPCAPCGPLSEGLGVLLYRLRRSFFFDAGHCFPDEFLAADPSSANNVSQVQSERDMLQTALDDILELALSPSQPGMSWTEIDARFRYFAGRLTKYVATSDGIRYESIHTRAAKPQ